MTAGELLVQCRALGVTLAPGSEGKLRISPPGVLPDELRQELKQHKVEILAVLQSPSCSCPQCGGAITPEEITPSLDGQRLLLWWRCEACQAWGIKTDSAPQPVVWMTTTMQ